MGRGGSGANETPFFVGVLILKNRESRGWIRQIAKMEDLSEAHRPHQAGFYKQAPGSHARIIAPYWPYKNEPLENNSGNAHVRFVPFLIVILLSHQSWTF